MRRKKNKKNAEHGALLPDVKISQKAIDAYTAMHQFIQSERNEGDPRPSHKVEELENIPRYIIFALVPENGDLEVESSGSCANITSDNAAVDGLIAGFTKYDNGTSSGTGDTEPRFGVVNYQEKVFFIFWEPDKAKATEKDQYETIMGQFKAALSGIDFFLSAKSDDDLMKTVFQEKVRLANTEDALANSYENQAIAEQLGSLGPRSEVWKKIWIFGCTSLGLMLFYRAYHRHGLISNSHMYVPLEGEILADVENTT